MGLGSLTACKRKRTHPHCRVESSHSARPLLVVEPSVHHGMLPPTKRLDRLRGACLGICWAKTDDGCHSVPRMREQVFGIDISPGQTHPNNNKNNNNSTSSSTDNISSNQQTLCDTQQNKHCALHRALPSRHS